MIGEVAGADDPAGLSCPALADATRSPCAGRDERAVEKEVPREPYDHPQS